MSQPNHAIERTERPDIDELDDAAFEGVGIDRRTFLSLSAATGAALALPGAVSAEDTVTDESLTDLAEFAVNHTPDDHEVTLVLEFEDADALAAFADEYAEPDWDPDESLRAAKAVTREEPTPAAHASLTADELADALELGGVEFVDFSPGANPSGSSTSRTPTASSRRSRGPATGSPTRKATGRSNTSRRSTPTASGFTPSARGRATRTSSRTRIPIRETSTSRS
jgi:hypothetical protein